MSRGRSGTGAPVPADLLSSPDAELTRVPASRFQGHVVGSGRFVYLSWGVVDAEGGFAMFRRAKLMLDAAGPAVLAAAVRSGLLLTRLGLTDACGQPLCGQCPVRLLSFLEEAHRLGVLRRVGPVYQFRHAELQNRLATRPS